ncbi:MAG: hypothetical protein AAF752_00680 [Bacteroidota bacterium]
MPTHPDRKAYRLALGLAILTAVLLVWVAGAVGIVGASGDQADLMYAGVLALGVVGAAVVRVRARGMAVVLSAIASVQMLTGIVALMAGWVPSYNSAFEVLGINGFFAVLWAGSAWLFWRVATLRKSAT